MGFQHYNANAINRYTDDCVIRAISCATNKSWDYVYDYLSDIAQYEGTLLDQRDFVRNYLDRTYKRLYGIQGIVQDDPLCCNLGGSGGYQHAKQA